MSLDPSNLVAHIVPSLGNDYIRQTIDAFREIDADILNSFGRQQTIGDVRRIVFIDRR